MATAEVVASSNGDMTPLIILLIIKYKYRYQYPKAGAQLSLVMYAFVCETALAFSSHGPRFRVNLYLRKQFNLNY